VSNITKLADYQVDALREYLLSDFEAFSQFCFKLQTGQKMITVDYYKVMFAALQTLIDQECTRMIINIPPRAGKTQIISIFLPLYAWCRNPHGQTILTGFNGDVLYECTGYIRNIMNDPDFLRVFPDVRMDMAKKSVERLGTLSGGVIHAVPTSGKVTGKGCGTLSDDFSGLMCIDDVIKPEDANSPTERNKINARFSNTLLSRLASEKTPLGIIMQRLHADDLAGFLMKGGTADIYHWLNIPGIITKETGSLNWYEEQMRTHGYTHVVPVTYDLGRDGSEFDRHGESSFWPIRKDVTTLQGMREKDPYTFYSQYMGDPTGKGVGVVDMDDIRQYDHLDKKEISYTFMTADTAVTTEDYSSNSVIVYWGVTKRAELLVLDIIKGKYQVPDLIPAVREFWLRYNQFDINYPQMLPKALYMEDKSSGQFLNQQFMKDGTVTVRPVARDGTNSKDKFTRFLNAVPYIKQSRLLLPINHEHTEFMKRELTGATEFGNSTGYWDFCDNVSDAVVIAFSVGQANYENWYN